MRSIVATCILLCASLLSGAQSVARLYLLPGQGSDHRIFSKIQFPAGIDTIHLHFLQPLSGEDMETYALRMTDQIDTTIPFALMGVSLGGMVAVEMSDIVPAEQVILLSSASSSEEIPGLYTFFKDHPVYHYIPSAVFKYSTFILQPVYEPDRRFERRICNSMISGKDPDFMKHAVHLIVSWQRKETDNMQTPIYQIHGSADHTLPVAHIKADRIIENGSHMMTLIRADEISLMLQELLHH